MPTTIALIRKDESSGGQDQRTVSSIAEARKVLDEWEHFPMAQSAPAAPKRRAAAKPKAKPKAKAKGKRK